jgi:hypothetical protein
MKTLEIDIETFSSTDLKKAGVYKYAESPDFEILLFGYSIDGGEIRVVDLASGENLPEEVLRALKDPGVIKWAFNSQFERICLSMWLGLSHGQYLDPRSWKCSMVWSAYLGFDSPFSTLPLKKSVSKSAASERALAAFFNSVTASDQSPVLPICLPPFPFAPTLML